MKTTSLGGLWEVLVNFEGREYQARFETRSLGEIFAQIFDLRELTTELRVRVLGTFDLQPSYVGKVLEKLLEGNFSAIY